MKIITRSKGVIAAMAAIAGLIWLAPGVPAMAEIKFKPPKGIGAPGRRLPGGSRGETCVPKAPPLIALVPQSNSGLTTVANPILFFYIPKTTAPRLELTVVNEQSKKVYQQSYQPSNRAGVVGLRLPRNTLTVGEPYKWSFSIVCNPTDRTSDLIVAGAIQRVDDPILKRKLATAPLQQRATLYAEAGVWYDSLAALAELRSTRPTDARLEADWEALLAAEGVALTQLARELTQAPLLQGPNAPQPLKDASLQTP